jgi:hypothetical protein
MSREDHILLRVCFLEFLYYLSILAILIFPVSTLLHQ